MNDIVLAIVSATLLILLLVSGIIIAFFISGRERMKQEKVLAETRLGFERELRQAETEVSEYIMAQFARELHDNIGQLLTAMHIQVQNQKLDHPELAPGMQPIEIYLAETTQQLRLLSRTLNNDYIGRVGLMAALQLEVERLSALRRFRVHWNATQGPSRLNKDQELMIFRIFQEITQNALRHSGAANFHISVKNEAEIFELRVQDDGKGFDEEEILRGNKASGLRNIRKRAQMAGFSCEIVSAPGKGTLFILSGLPQPGFL